LQLDAAFYLRGVGFAAGGAVFWLMYFDLKDRLQPEPRKHLVASFVLGAMAAVASIIVYDAVERLGFGEPRRPGRDLFAYCVLVIGLIEEGFKFLVYALIVSRWRDFDERMDAVVYAAAVAIGYATMENLLFLPSLTWTEQLARSLSSPITHSLFAFLWGYGMGRARFDGLGRTSGFLLVAGLLALSMVLHGFYDYALLAWGASEITAVIALVLWLLLIAHTRRLMARSRAAAPGEQGPPAGV